MATQSRLPTASPKRLAEAKTSLPPGVHLSTFYDQSQISQEAQASVVEAIVVGGLLALVVLMLFLGNLRTAAVVLLILPVTLLITFGLMKASRPDDEHHDPGRPRHRPWPGH